MKRELVSDTILYQRHDIQQNDIQYNDTQQNDKQRKRQAA
jgi:hypothetical protein